MATKIDYVKRIQARLSRQNLSFTKEQIRSVYNAFVTDPENPTEEEFANVLNRMKAQPNFATSPSEDSVSDTANEEEDAIVVSSHSEAIDMVSEETEDDNNDVWEADSLAEGESKIESSLATTKEPEQANGIVKSKPSSSGIPQSDVKELVSSTFANQPQGFQDQITEYALQHSFENVRQVQDFLEQLRGMEFNLLVQTLQDHFDRRGSMLNVLNEVLTGQKAKDEAQRTDFFITFNKRLASFQAEMEAKLTKRGI